MFHGPAFPLIRRCAPPSPTRGEGELRCVSGLDAPLLPSWEKVPEGRMRGNEPWLVHDLQDRLAAVGGANE
jgi:hypothetical protein